MNRGKVKSRLYGPGDDMGSEDNCDYENTQEYEFGKSGDERPKPKKKKYREPKPTYGNANDMKRPAGDAWDS